MTDCFRVSGTASFAPRERGDAGMGRWHRPRARCDAPPLVLRVQTTTTVAECPRVPTTSRRPGASQSRAPRCARQRWRGRYGGLGPAGGRGRCGGRTAECQDDGTEGRRSIAGRCPQPAPTTSLSGGAVDAASDESNFKIVKAVKCTVHPAALQQMCKRRIQDRIGAAVHPASGGVCCLLLMKVSGWDCMHCRLQQKASGKKKAFLPVRYSTEAQLYAAR
jgi:hypothetical protein